MLQLGKLILIEINSCIILISVRRFRLLTKNLLYCYSYQGFYNNIKTHVIFNIRKFLTLNYTVLNTMYPL